MSFTATLTRDAAAIELRLMQALDHRADQPVVHAMRYALRGGKRLRGFLVLEGARMHGLTDAQAISAAAAVTAKRLARAMVAMGHRPGMVVGPDPGGALVECDAVDMYIDAEGRVVSVVTLTEGDDDGE